MLNVSNRCGFIGLGSQGGPMARRMIEAGLNVTLWARKPQTLAPFRQTIAKFAATPAELAAQVEHVGVCVVNDADVQEVCSELIPAMPSPQSFAHGAFLLAKDVQLLGNVMAPRSVPFEALRDAAVPFLNLAPAESAQ